MDAIGWLKRGLVIFWAAWSTLVFASNLGDALTGLGLLPAAFPFASGNHAAIVDVTQIYGTPAAVAATLFGGVLAWDAMNAVLFWRAAADPRRRDVAFVVALGLWGALMIADELFLAYRVAGFEATHRAIFTSMLLSLLAVKLLPERATPQPPT